jgi:DNA-binding transcriptional LysR family regulator
MPRYFGQIYVLPILTECLQLYPNVVGRALFLDRITNIVDKGIDVAIRIGHLTDSRMGADQGPVVSGRPGAR